MKKLLLLFCTFIYSFLSSAEQKVFTRVVPGPVEVYRISDTLYFAKQIVSDTLDCGPQPTCYSKGTIVKSWEAMKCPDTLRSDSLYQQAYECPGTSINMKKSHGNLVEQTGWLASMVTIHEFRNGIMYLQKTEKDKMVIVSIEKIEDYPRLTVILTFLFILFFSIMSVLKLDALRDFTDSAMVKETRYLIVFYAILLLFYVLPRLTFFIYRPDIKWAMTSFCLLYIFLIVNKKLYTILYNKHSKIRVGIISRLLVIASLGCFIGIYYSTVHDISLTKQIIMYSTGISAITAFIIYAIRPIFEGIDWLVGKIGKIRISV